MAQYVGEIVPVDRSMEPDHIEKTNLELWGLYNLQRSSRHNVLYYGYRASWYIKWNSALQLVASVLSLSAVAGFLTIGSNGYAWGKWISGAVGAVSAICAAIPTVFEYAGQIKKFERLHFAYCEIYHLTQLLVLDIRRTTTLTVEQLGAAKLLNELYSRLGQMDETDVKSALSRQFEEQVRKEFPPERLWYTGTHVVPETAPTTT